MADTSLQRRRTCNSFRVSERAGQAGARLTRPAMSTTSRNADTEFLGLYVSTSHLKRSSGTLTRACTGTMHGYVLRC